MRGKFITFEGLDGCGKTTQLRLLGDHLRHLKQEVVQTVEPGGTEIGRQIRAILLNSANTALAPRAELLLYFASRAQNVEEVIRPALEKGATVLCDRFTDSTRAYQGAGRGLERATIELLDRVACGGLQPDLTVVIDIPLEISLERARRRNARVNSDETRLDDEAHVFHERVRDAYRELAHAEPERFVWIDGAAGIGAVQTRLQEALNGRV